MNAYKRSRFGLIAVAMFTLLAAMWAGLLRMGWAIPPLQPTLAGAHGPLMISGFLGTVIGLERSVGLGKGWAYSAPALTGVGALALVLGLPTWLGALLITLGSVGMLVVFGYIVKHQPLLHSYTMAIAAAAWVVGNLLWLSGRPINVLVPWWAGYLILTIAGERLELTRMLLISRFNQVLFLVVTGVYLLGAAVMLADYALGWRITGLGMLALAAWLLKNDIARRTIRQPGLTRFIAVCMLSGYLWLSVAGAIALWRGFLYGGYYDAALHAVFLGFVFGMIFGHAPVIFPAVLGLPMKFSPAFYAHLALLHVSLLLRVGSGLTAWLPGRRWGAMINVFALLLFLANTVIAIRRGRESKSP